MLARLENIGKRFQKEWIFRNVHLIFETGHKYAIIGYNGSGKSTFLQILAGILLPSEGEIAWQHQDRFHPVHTLIPTISFSSPYQELPEEFTAQELVSFHLSFKSLRSGVHRSSVLELIGLEKEAKKQIKYFSSGMKQRLRLGLCVFSESDMYIFDEPTTNLDKTGVQWYQSLIREPYFEDKLVVVGSNIASEYENFGTLINIVDYKS